MFIETEPTPNPQTLKFLPGRMLMANGSADFPTASTAARSPLAQRLFAIDGVEGVFISSDFVTITKNEALDWIQLRPPVLAAIMDALTGNVPVIIEDESAKAEPAEQDSEIVEQIKDLLETRVRPAVAQDGGDIIFDRFEDGVVYLQMQGSCSGCPSSTATLKMGIENMLKHYIPDVHEVRAA